MEDKILIRWAFFDNNYKSFCRDGYVDTTYNIYGECYKILNIHKYTKYEIVESKPKFIYLAITAQEDIINFEKFVYSVAY